MSMKRSAPASSPARASPSKQASGQDASSSSSPARKRGKTGDTLTGANSAPSQGPAAAAAVTNVDDEFDGEFDQDALLNAAEEFDAHPQILAAAESESNLRHANKSVQQTAISRGKISDEQKGSSSGSAVTEGSGSALLDEADHLAMEKKYMGKEWFEKLEDEMRKESFVKLKAFLRTERASRKTIYPPEHLIHSWSTVTPLARVKVVIVGQDPYHGPGQACGHSFSVPKGVAVPGSLKNIYKELAQEYPNAFTAPKHGNLDGWAKQGVLMLNACLTVRASEAGSHHGKGWEPFTRSVMKLVAAEAAKAGGGATAAVGESKIASMFAKKVGHSVVQGGGGASETGKSTNASAKGANGEASKAGGVVFLVWGQPAAKSIAEAGINEKSPNVLILRSAHPSPLSAHRGFLGNGHFKKANEWLEKRHGPDGGIDWGHLP